MRIGWLTSARVLTALALFASLLSFSPLEAASPPAISGVAFRDVNADGLLDADENPLAGAQVELRDATTGLIVAGPVTTGPDGAFVFENQPEGTYRVRVTSPDNFLVSDATVDNQINPIAGNEKVGRSDPIVLGATDDIVIGAAVRPRPELGLGYFGPGIIDGTPDFNLDGACADPSDTIADGEDCGPDNGVVRTQDITQFVWSVTADNYEPGAPNLSDVIFEQTIIPSGGAEMAFESIPVVCVAPPSGSGGTNPISSIVENPDGSVTLICNLGEFTEGGQESFSTSIKAKGTSPNGSSFTTTQRVYSNGAGGEPNAVPDDVPETDSFEISASPRFDIDKFQFRHQDIIVRDIGNGPEEGYRTYFSFGIGSDRAVGIEALEQPFTFTENVFAFASDGTTPYPIEYEMIECRPHPNWNWPEVVLGVESYHGTAQYPDSKVIDSGTCGFSRTDPADLNSPYEMTISGLDMSGLRYPTQRMGGADLSAGPFYVGFYRAQIFIPFRVIDAEDGVMDNGNGAIQLYNSIEDFDPNGTSGTSNYGDGVEPGYNQAPMEDGSRSNNMIGPTTFELRVAGAWTKYLRGSPMNINGTSHPLVSGQTGSHGGDGEIEPGQFFHGLVDFRNSGTQGLNNPVVCDVFDNATMVLTDRSNLGVTPSDYAYIGTYRTAQDQNNAAWPSNFIVEYASADFTGDDPLVDGFNVLTNRWDGTWDVQRSTFCDDDLAVFPDGWFADPNAVPGGIDAVNAVRARFVDPTNSLASGEFMRLNVPLQARDTFNGGPHAGDLIPTGTVLANFGNVRTDEWLPGWRNREYRPSPETSNTDGDRVTLTRAQIRLQKRSLVPFADVGEAGATLAGNQIVWELIPTISSTVDGAEATNVTIVDVLPPEVTYNATCTAATAGGTPAGLVEPNTALDGSSAPGYTRLTWVLGDRPANVALDRLVICTDSDPLAPNGTSVINYAEMRADNVISSLSQRSDDHTIVLEQAGSIQVSKSVDLTLDDLDDDQEFQLGFSNFSSTFTVQPPTLIDVFPHAGDGLGGLSERDPESDYTGTYELAGEPTITWLDGSTPGGGDPFATLGLFEYSATDPTLITYDPDANAVDGVTVWCSYAAGSFTQSSGVAGTCPTTFADVTALKFTSNYDLEVDGNPRQGMLIDFTMEARGNTPGDLYTNRFGLDSATLPPEQFLRSNNVTVRIASFSIGDFIFADADGDGAFDPTIDIPAPDGVTVELRRPDGTLVGTTDTSVLGGGRFLFDLLASGDYELTIPASDFAAGGVLADWVVTPVTGTEDDDFNEDNDQHGITAGTETADGVETNTITLSAIAPAPGQLPVGEEPLGDNPAGLFDETLDDFSNLTLDIGLVGPPSIAIQKEICTLADNSCAVGDAVGTGGWADTATVDYTEDALWRIIVTNDGYQVLENVVVTDPVESDCARTEVTEADLAQIVPNDSVAWLCTSTNVVDGFVNTASVTADGVVSGMVSDDDAAEVDVPAGSPDIVVEKFVNGQDANAAPGVYVPVGGVVEWTYRVTNPGVIPLDGVTIVDDAGTPADDSDDWTITDAALLSGDTDSDGLLDTDETWLFEAPATGTAVEGLYTNFAAVAADPVGPEGPVLDSDPASYFGADGGGIEVDKRVNGQDSSAAPGPNIATGDDITWTYTVTNTSNTPVSNVSVTDDQEGPATLISGDANNNSILEPTETWIYEITGTATAGAYENTATVEGTGPETTNPDGSTTPGESFADSDTTHHFGTDPGINVEKVTNTVDTGAGDVPFIAEGADVTWTYTVTNTGNVPIANVTVVDDNGTSANATDDFGTLLLSGDDNMNSLLDLDETWVFEAVGTAVSGGYENTATASGDGPDTIADDGSTVDGDEASDTDDSEYFGTSPAIEVDKAVNTSSGSSIFVPTGSPIEWTFTVTNPGNIELDNVEVVDNNGTPGDPGDDWTLTVADLDSGDTDNDGRLDPGETWTFVVDGTATPGAFTNTAAVSGDAPDTTLPDGSSDPGEEVTSDDDAELFGTDGGIAIAKSVNGDGADTDPGLFVEPGQAVDWRYEVTNTSNTALTDVSVTDDAGTPSDPADDWVLTVADLVSGDDDADDELDVGETWIFEATGLATLGQYTNSAVVEGTGPETTAPDGSTVPGATLTGGDTASHYGWSSSVEIEKFVNGEDADEAPGPYLAIDDPVSWTYVVTNTGSVWLTDVVVTDDQGVAVTCPATVLAPFGDAAGRDTMTCTSEIQLVTAGAYVNVGTVTGSPAIPTPGEPIDPDTGLPPLTLVTNPDGTTPVTPSSGEDAAHHFGSGPAIEMNKTVCVVDDCDIDDPTHWGEQAVVATGDQAVWRLEVTNTGNVELTDIEAIDPAVPECERSIAALAPGESEAWTCSITEVELIVDFFENVATVVGTSPVEDTGTDCDDRSLAFCNSDITSTDTAEVIQPASFSVQKLANSETAQLGDVVDFTLIVSNDGSRTLTDIEVADTPTSGTEVVAVPDDTVRDGDVLRWTIDELGPGEVFEIEYSLRMNATGDFANQVEILSNDVTNPVGITPDDPDDNSAEITFAVSSPPPLAFTGANSLTLVQIALGLLLLGLFLVRTDRRRRPMGSGLT